MISFDCGCSIIRGFFCYLGVVLWSDGCCLIIWFGLIRKFKFGSGCCIDWDGIGGFELSDDVVVVV